MRKTIVSVAVLTALLVVAQAIRGRAVSQEQQEQKDKIGYDASRENDSTTIEYLVKNAKAKGLNRIVRGNPHREPVRVKGVDDAIDRFSTIVVTPLEKTSQIQFLGAGLETLYRCKISEKLSLNKKAASCCGISDLRKLVRNIPSETEISEDEIYLRIAGGSIAVDGVEVVQEEYPANLELGRTYLVFLAHDDPAKVGKPGLGGRGVYEIQSDGQLSSKSRGSTADLLADDLRNKMDNSLSRLKDHIQRKSTTIK